MARRRSRSRPPRRRSRKRATASGVWFVGRHIRGLCVNTWTASPPIASARSIACRDAAGGGDVGAEQHRRRYRLAVRRPTCSDDVRVRMAPSPTGFLHIGGVRTFLFNWLFARGRGGECLLRIENTDTSREVAESVEQIERSLRWLGIEWDGETTLPARRRGALPRGGAPARRGGQGVRGRRRDPDPHAGRGRRSAGTTRSRGGSSSRTRSSRTSSSSARTAGPTYNFASPLDDWVDGITHVIRGDDHVSNTPKQIVVLRGARRRAARLRARAERLRRGRQEALEAARRRLGRRVPRRRATSRRGADELPRAARLGARRRDDDHVARRARRAVHARARRRRARRRSTTPSSTG